MPFLQYNRLMARFLGIDYGEKRIGIALSDEGGKIAMPHGVFPNDRTLFREIKDLCHGYKIKTVVMGESKDFKGNENPIMKKIKEFKAELERDLKVKVELEPEFMTSIQATREQGNNPFIDASAAALILQSYLDRAKK